MVRKTHGPSPASRPLWPCSRRRFRRRPATGDIVAQPSQEGVHDHSRHAVILASSSRAERAARDEAARSPPSSGAGADREQRQRRQLGGERPTGAAGQGGDADGPGAAQGGVRPRCNAQPVAACQQAGARPPERHTACRWRRDPLCDFVSSPPSSETDHLSHCVCSYAGTHSRRTLTSSSSWAARRVRRA